MKPRKLTRRRFLLAAALLSSPLVVCADAKWLEPKWLKVRRVKLGWNAPRHRFLQFTDVHHKGDRAYLLSVVKTINALSPEFVFFTGDVIEEGKFLPEALEILAAIKSPMYGVPGNHDYWSRVPFDGLSKCFAATGGRWLLDEEIATPDGKFTISGAACLSPHKPPLRGHPATTNIFLMHYPAWVEKLAGKFDLILAGHSHGGQVRLPFYGPLIIPFNVGPYRPRNVPHPRRAAVCQPRHRLVSRAHSLQLPSGDNCVRVGLIGVRCRPLAFGLQSPPARH